MLEYFHGQYIHPRRVGVLAKHFAELLPENASVLDVGCGDGLFDRELLRLRPDLAIQGIDVLVRNVTEIEIAWFDGETFPCGDATFDVVLFVDVLHHVAHPLGLLLQARRVSRRNILIKDHFLSGILALETLRWMDRVGNQRHGVAIPGRYLTREQWRALFREAGLCVADLREHLGLYPWPLRPLCERSLHFLARLMPGTA